MSQFPTPSIARSPLHPANQVGAAVALTGVQVKEYTSGQINRTRITLTDVAVTMTDEAGVVAYGGVALYTLPASALILLGGIADLAIVESGGINADFDGDFAVGTTTASNNASLASGEANIIPSTATPQAVASATTAQGCGGTPVLSDGTAAAKQVFLNFVVDDADQNGGGTITVNGFIEFAWMNLGNYTT